MFTKTINYKLDVEEGYNVNDEMQCQRCLCVLLVRTQVVLRRWRERSREVKNERLANERARRHYSRTLGKRVLSTWRIHIQHHKNYQVRLQLSMSRYSTL